ncbi:hypothetical protein [Glycomyces buryatensis]|uniref:Uncharacterized protein n=1 Tax=Glycomyces buryatensis TaxID=2570927 RepID=A0A4V4HRA7_9ACTN|nr:hypothetical protein [Glycomyces buryatensis]THV37066.1 hypothetical protein FAB82_21185 [Glycomyces buryatensis]
MESSVNPQEAQAALDSVQQSRSDIADRLYTPWWYHPALGVLVGGLVAAVTGGVHFSVLLVVYTAGLVGLVYTYRRVAGVWINGYEAGPKSRRSLFRFVVVLLVIGIVGAAFSIGMELRWFTPITGLVIAVYTTVWGRQFDKVLRADLREAA